jgi:arginase
LRRAPSSAGEGSHGRERLVMIASSRLELERPAPKIVDRVDVIGVPMDLGADRRGVDMGPFAVRYARLREGLQALGIGTALDHGNIAVPVPEAASVADQHAKYLPIILAVCEELAQIVERVVREGGFPIVLGGDHSIAIGTLAGLYRARGRQPGLIWIDAHGDINTPLTSPSGNVHGMPLAISLEENAVAAERTVLIGLRDVDAGEKRAIREFGVRAYTMTDIDRLGMERVIDEAIAIVGTDPRSVHVSFDMDGIDPSEAPGVGTPVRGGISYREAHLAMEALAASGALGSIEITEINPILDDRNRTAQLAVELILSGLGKTII